MPRGGGGAEVRAQCYWISVRDGGAAMVHRGVLPRPRLHLGDGEGRRSALEPTQGSGAAGGGGLQRETCNTGGGQESGRHRYDAGNGGTRGHGETLPAAGEQVVSVSEEVGDASKMKGGAVPDGLHPGDGPPSFQVRHSPGPLAQLGPLHGPGLPTEFPPEGEQAVHWRKETVAGEAAGETNEDGPTFCGSTESRTEGATVQGETKRLDLRDDLETHRRESLRTPGTAIRAGFHTASWEGGEEEPGRRQETAGGRSGGGGRGFGEGGPAPHTGGVVPHSGVVQGCS